MFYILKFVFDSEKRRYGHSIILGKKLQGLYLLEGSHSKTFKQQEFIPLQITDMLQWVADMGGGGLSNPFTPNNLITIIIKQSIVLVKNGTFCYCFDCRLDYIKKTSLTFSPCQYFLTYKIIIWITTLRGHLNPLKSNTCTNT